MVPPDPEGGVSEIQFAVVYAPKLNKSGRNRNRNTVIQLYMYSCTPIQVIQLYSYTSCTPNTVYTVTCIQLYSYTYNTVIQLYRCTVIQLYRRLLYSYMYTVIHYTSLPS